MIRYTMFLSLLVLCLSGCGSSQGAATTSRVGSTTDTSSEDSDTGPDAGSRTDAGSSSDVSNHSDVDAADEPDFTAPDDDVDVTDIEIGNNDTGTADSSDDVEVDGSDDADTADGSDTDTDEEPLDRDEDRIPDSEDNCPDFINPSQSDEDGDGIGDVCDDDADNDGVPDMDDNCVFVENPDQADTDGDTYGDACDDVTDSDDDGVQDADDNCASDENPDQSDVDGDGIGDVCDPVDDRPGDVAISLIRNDGYTDGETFVAGALDACVLRFIVDVDSLQPVYLRTVGLDLIHPAGPSEFDNYTNFELVTEEGEVITDSVDVSRSGRIVFSGINRTVEPDEDFVLCLSGDIQYTAMAYYGVQFRITEFLVDDHHGDLVEDVTLTESVELFISEGALLTVTLSGDTPHTRVIPVNGSGAWDLATFRVTAEDDGAWISDLYIANNPVVDETNTTETDADPRVRYYELVWDGRVLDRVTPTGGRVHFELVGDDRIYIDRNRGGEQFTIRGVFNDITRSSETGSQIALALYAMEAQTEGSGMDIPFTSMFNIESNTDDLSVLDESQTGNVMHLHATRATVSAAALSDTVLKNGNMDFFRFTVTADAAGDVGWIAVALSISGDCGDTTHVIECMSNIVITDDSGDELRNVRVIYDSGTPNQLVLTMWPEDRDVHGMPETIAAGTSRTYTVEADLAGFEDGDVISTRISDSGAECPIVWSDYSGTDEDTTDPDQWFCGRPLPGLSTDTVSLVKPS